MDDSTSVTLSPALHIVCSRTMDRSAQMDVRQAATRAPLHDRHNMDVPASRLHDRREMPTGTTVLVADPVSRDEFRRWILEDVPICDTCTRLARSPMIFIGGRLYLSVESVARARTVGVFKSSLNGQLQDLAVHWRDCLLGGGMGLICCSCIS